MPLLAWRSARFNLWTVHVRIGSSYLLQRVPCLSKSCVGGEGHGHFVYISILGFRVLCHLAQYACPIVLLLSSGL